MDKESLREFRTDLNKILRAAERVTLISSGLTPEEENFFLTLRRRFQRHATRSLEIQNRVCGPPNTQWYKMAWNKMKNIPVLAFNQVIELHKASCIRSTEIAEPPDPISRKEFLVLLLSLCVLYYGSIFFLLYFYPYCYETTANTTDASDQVFSSFVTMFYLLVTSLFLLSLFVKFFTMLPWSICYCFWLVAYLFTKTPNPERTEEH